MKKAIAMVLAVMIGLTVMACDSGGDKEHPDKKLWGTRIDGGAVATVSVSVASNGVCTIVVGGEAEEEGAVWKAIAEYSYTPAANTEYEYKFEAWTASGSRNLLVQFNDDVDNKEWFAASFNINSTRTIYILNTKTTCEWENWTRTSDRYVGNLQFHCADQLGTFYVRMISITPLPSP